MSEIIKIGSWEFAPSTGVLTQGLQSRRLEHRASALLEMLCRNSGVLVTHPDILDQVWNGRSVSPNSVAVVIADIRRALGDNARKPKFIETLHKRGYRMIAPIVMPETEKPELVPDLPTVGEPSWAHKNRRSIILTGVIGLGGLVLASRFIGKTAGPESTISIATLENKTESAEYDALTIALYELLSFEIMRSGNLKIATENDADYLMSGKLIMWDGHPALSLHAKSKTGEEKIWSGMASGPEVKLPQQVRKEVREFETVIRRTKQ